VTDVVATQLTERQVKEIEARCGSGAGIPGTTCKEIPLILDGDRVHPIRLILDGDRVLPTQCQQSLCMFVGTSVSDPGLGVLAIVDDRPGSPACDGETATLCEGITVDVALVEAVIGAAREATPVPHALSEPPSELPEPTSTRPQGDTATSQPGTSGDNGEATTAP
jgi:hypothetical protein